MKKSLSMVMGLAVVTAMLTIPASAEETLKVGFSELYIHFLINQNVYDNLKTERIKISIL